ncbi:MAG: phosphatidate cytidylyltransferase [Flavobacteriales bacterium]|nr:phosphatidate cytidylyltransferase [Flavobacteriales bacterium]
MKELLVRAASGAVYAVLVIGSALLGPWAAAILFLLVCLIAARELHRLGVTGLTLAASYVVALVTYVGVAALPLLTPQELPSLLVFAHVILLLIVLAFLQRRLRDPLLSAAAFASYIAAPFAFAVWLAAVDAWLFIGFMLLLWTNDTGAYLVGKSIGRNKLMPSVSPGKTWEGFVGGVALAMLAAWPISDLSSALPLHGWLIAAGGVAIAGTVGDLYESALKRKAGVKDSGRIMPGHGGALDRFDGYLLAAPVMLLVVLLMS